MSFVTLANFPHYYQAAPAKSLLESEGIYCHLKDEHTATTMHDYGSTIIGGVKLQVNSKDYETAKEVLLNSGYEIITESDYKPNAIKPKTVFRLLYVLIPVILLIILILLYRSGNL